VDTMAEEVPLLGLFGSILEELEGDIRERGLQVEVRPGVEELVLYGNADRLRLLFFNLVENAVKFNEPGGRILLSATTLPTQVEVSIVNTGGEIAAERLAKLTAPFTQGDMSVTRGAGGLGLGLSVAKAIASAYGGGIHLESSRGQGTAVTVSMPRSRRMASR